MALLLLIGYYILKKLTNTYLLIIIIKHQQALEHIKLIFFQMVLRFQEVVVELIIVDKAIIIIVGQKTLTQKFQNLQLVLVQELM